MSQPGTSLTEHLLSLQTKTPYSAATRHPFLESAGNGTLEHDTLALWLAQDRIYAAHAYPRFIGSLIANISYDSRDTMECASEALNQRVLKVLVFCLENIVREVDFFKETSKKWDLDLDIWKERKGTRDYTAEMSRVSRCGRLEDGLVFLWAMEKVYLDAWSHIHEEVVKGSLNTPAGSPTVAAVLSLADNWSCPDFVKFVDDLADLVNSLGITPGSASWKRAEDIWARVVELEEAFWPIQGETQVSRKDA